MHLQGLALQIARLDGVRVMGACTKRGPFFFLERDKRAGNQPDGSGGRQHGTDKGTPLLPGRRRRRRRLLAGEREEGGRAALARLPRHVDVGGNGSRISFQTPNPCTPHLVVARSTEGT
jgi:hypothetical protein